MLKKPENKSSLNPVLQNLGLRQGKEFPSPQQFVQSQYFSENGEEVVSKVLLTSLTLIGVSTSQRSGGSGELSNYNFPYLNWAAHFSKNRKEVVRSSGYILN